MQPAAKASPALRVIVRDPKEPIGVCTAITLIDPSVKLGTSTAEPLGDFRAGPNTDGASVAAPKFHLVGRAADQVLQVCPTLRWRETDSNFRSREDGSSIETIPITSSCSWQGTASLLLPSGLEQPFEHGTILGFSPMSGARPKTR